MVDLFHYFYVLEKKNPNKTPSKIPLMFVNTTVEL